MPSTTPVLNGKVTDKKPFVYPEIPATATHKEIVKRVFESFRDAQQNRDQKLNFFDGDNLIDYINDSVIRFITNYDERDGLEDWQAKVNMPLTRNKIIAILGR